MNAVRPATIARLLLAALMPVALTAALWSMALRERQKLDAAQAIQARIEAGLRTLRQQQAEFAPNTPGASRYADLAGEGFLSEPDAASLRATLEAAQANMPQTRIVWDMTAPVKLAMDAPQPLGLYETRINLRISAASDEPVYGLLDRLATSGHGRMVIDALSLRREGDTVVAEAALRWLNLTGAPVAEKSATASLSALADGTSLFPPISKDTAPAKGLYIKVDRAER